MRAKEHPDFPHEDAHLQSTLTRIRELRGALGEREAEASAGVLDILQGAAKPEDLDMLQQQQLRSINQRQLLRLAENDPYFGRIDVTTLDYLFHHNLTLEKTASERSPAAEKISDNRRETLYVGKIGVENEQKGEQVVVDWRAPVADLYYGGSTGRTFFYGPYGPINCDVHLLRRFMIDHSQLAEISDVEDDGGGVDDYLLSRLQQNADTGMKDIVSTIRRDQNEIIRMPLAQPVIVQGVAGSGKTSVALHRLSYLLYAHKGRLFPEDTLILTPSQLFFGYIASVMPGLDIKRCRQSTFANLAKDELGFKLHVVTPNEAMARLSRIKGQDEFQEAWDRLLPARRAKGSLPLLAGIERYIDYLAQQAVPEEDITANRFLLVSHQAIHDRYHDLRHLPLQKRIEEIKKWLPRAMKPALAKHEATLRERFERSLERVRAKRRPSQDHLPNPAAAQLIDERDRTIARLRELAKESIASYRQQIPGKLDLIGIYRQFLSSPDLLREFAPELSSEEVQGLGELMQSLPKNTLEQEDLAPLLKVHELVNGLSHRYEHVVIDEAQDTNPAELAMVRRWLDGGNSMTVVGDLAQGIYPHRGLDDWHQLSEGILDGKEIVFREMRRSYRSSAEIINLANEVLALDPSSPSRSEAVRYTGHKPTRMAIKPGKGAKQELIAHVSSTVERYTGEGFKSVAVIAKTHELCQLLYDGLVKLLGDKVSLVLSEDDRYNSPVVVIPTYLAKGLEFDTVIIPDADRHTYRDTAFDRRLLYVALTRPLHRLALLAEDDWTTPLGQADAGLFAES